MIMKKYMKIFSAVTAFFCAASFLAGCANKRSGELSEGELIVNENVNVIKLAVTSFDTLNPIMTKSASIAEFMKNVCEPLFEYDAAGNPMGVLADDYSLSDDGTVFSFDIKSVKFHDSAKLSAKDVIYTVNLIKDNDTLYSDNVKYIKDIFTGDDGRIYVTLTKPVINFAGMLNFPIVKSGTPAEVDQNYIPVGTGPCKYYGKNSANQITFTSNENWHGGKTGFKDVVINLLKDGSTAMYSLDAGEVDVVSSELTGIKEITARSEYTENEYISNELVFLGINNTKSMLSGKWTRKAIELLCDREKIVDVEVYSKGKAVKIPINPYVWFNAELGEEARDYGSVEEILIKDGWMKDENGYYRDYNGKKQNLELEILVSEENEEKVRIAQNVADSLNSFGIKASLKTEKFKKYKSLVSQKSYDLFLGEIHIDDNMDPSFLTKASGNYFGYNNPSLDEILLNMAQTTDGNAIKELASEYAKIFNDEVPFVTLFFRTESVIYNKHISGITAPDCLQIYKDMDKWYISKTK